MGRNIFQAEDPVAMLRALNVIVHDGEKVDQAWQLYRDEKTDNDRRRKVA